MIFPEDASKLNELSATYHVLNAIPPNRDAQTIIDTIIKAEHPYLANQNLSANKNSLLSAQNAHKFREAETLRKHLLSLSSEELQKELSTRQEAARINLTEFRNSREYKVSPTNKPDYKYWCNFGYWSIEEGLALSLGIDPKNLNRNYLTLYVPFGGIAEEFFAREETAKRAKAMGTLLDKNIPSFFLSWALSVDYKVPDELTSNTKTPLLPLSRYEELFEKSKEIARLNALLEDQQPSPATAPPLGSKKEESLLRTIGALCLTITHAGGGKKYYKTDPLSPNVKAITDETINILEKNDLKQTSLAQSSLQERITQGLKILKKMS